MTLDRTTRNRMLWIAACALVVLAVGVAVGVTRSDGAAGPPISVPIEPALQMPDAVLTDQHGEPFDLRERTAGRVTLLYFGYLNCPDACPIHMQILGDVMETLQPDVRDQIEVIFVTTDPARDTPEALGAFLEHFDPTFIGLTAPAGTLVDLQIAAGLPVAVIEPTNSDGGYLVGHSTQVLVFGADGYARRAFPFGVRETDWASALPKIVAEGEGTP